MIRSILACSAFLCVLLSLVVTQQNSDCHSYCDGELNSTKLNAVCFDTSTDPNCRTCRFYDNSCPEVKTCKHKKTQDGECVLCDEEVCAYGKKGYKALDTFKAFDEKNECTCNIDGTVTCDDSIIVLMSDICEIV